MRLAARKNGQRAAHSSSSKWWLVHVRLLLLLFGWHKRSAFAFLYFDSQIKQAREGSLFIRPSPAAWPNLILRLNRNGNKMFFFCAVLCILAFSLMFLRPTRSCQFKTEKAIISYSNYNINLIPFSLPFSVQLRLATRAF